MTDRTPVLDKLTVILKHGELVIKKEFQFDVRKLAEKDRRFEWLHIGTYRREIEDECVSDLMWEAFDVDFQWEVGGEGKHA